MLLAVAGLEREAVTEHTRRLALGEWDHFSPGARAAFAFARKSGGGRLPDAADYRELAACLGRERALDVVWWVAHCHYMTCIADAFQLPLEHENVFDGFQVGGGADHAAP